MDGSAAGFSVGGTFHMTCVGPDGQVKWEADLKNIVPDPALNDVLDVYLRAQTQKTVWYMGLVDNSAWTAFAAADTLASHSGWTEIAPGTGYTGNRLAWTPAAAASKSIANSSTVNFPMLGTYTVKGVFLASVATGTSGILFAEAAFTGGTQAVNNGDTLKVTYTINASTS
jgi:hypothetical protein